MQASSYYLIWSPGFVQKFAWASGSLWGMHMLQWDARLSKMMTQQWKALSATFPALLSNRVAATAAPNMVLPLLSSSCCLIQLLINVLVGAGGCAGFNTVLGPVRPLFLAMLVSLNIFTGASLRQSLWRYSIALMPEGVHFWNELRKRQWRNRVESTANSADQSRIRATVMVDIPTMGCVACINKIESSLRACAPNNVLTASSWLEEDRKGGCAKLDVYVDSEDDLKALSQTVVDAIERAGFQDSVVTATEITSKT
jgi:copper chaperone CopZ